MGRFLTALSACATLLALAGCGNSPLFNHDTESSLRAAAGGLGALGDGACWLRFSPQLCATVTQKSISHEGGPSVFVLRFQGPNGQPTEPGRLLPTSKAWMPSMPSMFPSRVSFQRMMDGETPVPGAYEATTTFTMSGEWVIDLILNDGAAERTARISGIQI